MVRESKFKKDFIKDLKKKAKIVYVLQYKQDATTVAGFPDTIVIMEGITVFIEFKQHKRAKYQPGQKQCLEKLEKAGHFTFVCYPENAKEVMAELVRLAA